MRTLELSRRPEQVGGKLGAADHGDTSAASCRRESATKASATAASLAASFRAPALVAGLLADVSVPERPSGGGVKIRHVSQLFPPGPKTEPGRSRSGLGDRSDSGREISPTGARAVAAPPFPTISAGCDG